MLGVYYVISHTSLGGYIYQGRLLEGLEVAIDHHMAKMFVLKSVIRKYKDKKVERFPFLFYVKYPQNTQGLECYKSKVANSSILC